MRTSLPVLVGVLLLAGCTTVRYSTTFHDVKVEDGETPLEIVEIENSGWELFKFIPLASGNPQKPNRLSCRWFSNTVTLQNNLNLLEMEMKAKGVRRFTNLVSRNSEESFLFILLTRNAYHTSAVLLKDANTPTPPSTAGKKESAK
jgi:hypothetical protein